MKKTKVIIPALGLLLLSTAASVTGTVAWFSMNGEVTANGMAVTAKSDAAFLLIKAGTAANAGIIQAAPATTASAESPSAQLYPVAHEAGLTNAAGYNQVSNWYYKYADAPTASASTGAKTTLSAFTDYVLHNQFSITVSKGSLSVTNLHVSSCSITTSGSQAVNVVVASSSAATEFTATDNDGDATVLASTIDASTVVLIDVFVYWNGEDTDVYSDNLENLKNTDVVINFAATLPSNS